MLRINVTTSDTGPVNLPGNLRPVLDTIAADWRSEIIARTPSGKGADGRQMRRRADGTVSRLHDTGAMLASLQADVGDRGFSIAPTGRRNRTIAAVHQATGRRWAGADERQIADARRAVVDALQGTK